MKRLAIAAVSTLLLAGAANAADMPVKGPIYKAAPAPFSWTGFYVGGFYGTTLGQSKGSTPLGEPGEVEINDGGIASSGTFTVGGTLGYNWQFSPAWLLGVESEIGWLGTSHHYQDFDDPESRVGVKSQWYGTVRGRLGYVTGPSLLYVTGGAAAVNLKETFGITPNPTEYSTTQWGWTVGGGIETRLSRAWSITTEYLYIDPGSNTFTSNAGAPDLEGSGPANYDNRFHVIKSGLNYKFGEPLQPLPLFTPAWSSPRRWAGLYAGVNAGGGLSLVQLPSNIYGPYRGEVDINGTGFTAGGQIGYNWVVFSHWIAGVEGDIGYLGIDHSVVDWFNTGSEGALFQPSVRTHWYGTLRGRIGTSTGPAFIYFTGGAAFVNVNDSSNWKGTLASSESTRSGWTLGGGTEVALNSRWSARLEYLYLDVGKETVLNSEGDSSEFKNRFAVIRAGLNYTFGGL